MFMNDYKIYAMKRNLLIVLIAAMVLVIIAPSSFAQEENTEKSLKKRVKIVKVDEKGEKVIIDTILTGDMDMEGIEAVEGIHIKKGDGTTWTIEDGNVFIMKKGDRHKYSFYSDDEGEVIEKEGVIVVKTDDGKTFSVIEIDEDDEDAMKNIMIEIDEDVIHSRGEHIIMKAGKNSNHAFIVASDKKGNKNLEWVSEDDNLKEGQTHIVIRSKNEVQDLIIEGDAVITIKDGEVKMEGDTIKSDISKEKGDSKVVKKKKEERNTKSR